MNAWRLIVLAATELQVQKERRHFEFVNIFIQVFAPAYILGLWVTIFARLQPTLPLVTCSSCFMVSPSVNETAARS